MKVIIVFVCLSLIVTEQILAQAGTLDTTFANGGKDTIVFIPNDASYGTSVAIQPDNKIMVSGVYYQYVLTRLNYNGSIDSTFGERTAAVPGGGGATFIAIQPDGKVIQSGSSSLGFALIRYNNNGTFDSSFAVNGLAITSFGNNSEGGLKVLIQPDGKIVQSGNYESAPFYPDFAIVRWNSDGTLDNTFGNGGKVLTDFNNRQDGIYGIGLQADGKIVAGGISSSMDFPTDIKFAIARYNTNGTLDNSFGVNGKVIGPADRISFLYDIYVLPNGRILGAGGFPDTTYTSFSKLIMFKSNGEIDSSFGVNGQIYDLNPKRVVPWSLALQPDGKIILAGGGDYNSFNGFHKFGVERYNADGSLDSTFGDAGLALADLSFGNGDNEVRDVKITPDGKIVLVGSAEYEPYQYCIAIARFLSGLNVGILNLSIPDNSILIYPNPIGSQANLKYILTNQENINISLFNLQGEKVQVFVTNQSQAQGDHEEQLEFDRSLVSGNYILSISNGIGKQNIKIVLVR